MVGNRGGRASRKRAAQAQAKRALRAEQTRRRRRDNVFAATALVVLIAAAVVVQLTVFVHNPTVRQMENVEKGLQVPSGSASPLSTATPTSTPVPTPDLTPAPTPAPTPDSRNTNGPGISAPGAATGKIFNGTLTTNRASLTPRPNGRFAQQAVSVVKTLVVDDFHIGRRCQRLTTGPAMGVLQCGARAGDGAADPDLP